MPISDFLTDLLNPDLAFLPKALAVTVMSSIVCGVIGCHVVLRGMAFIGDAIAHAVFPGVAVAFVVQGSLVVGGAVAGVVTAVLVAAFSHDRRVKEDSVIGVLFVAAFALGIVVISQAPGYSGSLQQFLFGSLTGIPDEDVLRVGLAGLLVLGVVLGLHKELVAVSLDREMARAMGLRTFWLDIVLYVCVTLAVVMSLQTIGNVLVLALLVTPAATARLLTDRLGWMMVLSPTVGAAGATVGLYLSWSYDLPVGGTIVLVLTGAFLLAWFLGPRHGLVARVVGRPARPGFRRRPGGQGVGDTAHLGGNMPEADDLKGRVKEAAGDLTGDEDLQREGKVDQASGKVKEMLEDAKEKVEGVIDDIKDRVNRD